jgi:hypothetical protein
MKTITKFRKQAIKFLDNKNTILFQKFFTSGLNLIDLIQTKKLFELGKEILGEDKAHEAELNPIIKLIYKTTGFKGVIALKSLVSVLPFISDKNTVRFLNLFYLGVVSWNAYILYDTDKYLKEEAKEKEIKNSKINKEMGIIK